MNEPKLLIGNPLLDKWLYSYNQNKILFETPLSKIMLFVQPNELLLCGTGDTLVSIIKKLKGGNYGR